jgi:hypothetical protein
MSIKRLSKLVIDTIEGRTPELDGVPCEKLDWAGPAAFLRLFHRTSGGDREAIIRAMGQVIREHLAAPEVIAQVIDIASNLNLAQIEPDVRALARHHKLTSAEPLRGAIANFLSFREVGREVGHGKSPGGRA